MYFVGENRDQLLRKTFETLVNNKPIKASEVVVQMGRKLVVQEAGATCALCPASTADLACITKDVVAVIEIT